MTRIPFPLALAALSILMLPQAALAEELKFCTGERCGIFTLVNTSSAIVTKIKMTQRAGSNNCPKVTKTRRRNMVIYINVKVHRNCPYTVTFKTTKGCIGNKTVDISIEDLKATRYVDVRLTGACGTLKAVQSRGIIPGK